MAWRVDSVAIWRSLMIVVAVGWMPSWIICSSHLLWLRESIPFSIKALKVFKSGRKPARRRSLNAWNYGSTGRACPIGRT